jgi:transposase InsO family protein
MFTNWMEATPVVNITQEAIVKFLPIIIFRFNLPKWVITDSDTEFKGAKFARCFADFGINHQASLVAHPRTIGQVEHVNRLIVQIMKTRMFHDLEAKGRNSPKELASVVWALRTNVN